MCVCVCVCVFSSCLFHHVLCWLLQLIPHVFQSPSHVQLFMTPWTAVYQASLSLTISLSLPKFISIELEMPSSHFTLFYPLLLLPSVFCSIRFFSKELAVHIRWPKYWSFNLSISPSNEYSELISFKTDWFLRVKRF